MATKIFKQRYGEKVERGRGGKVKRRRGEERR
jgi:hypothetical protein